MSIQILTFQSRFCTSEISACCHWNVNISPTLCFGCQFSVFPYTASALSGKHTGSLACYNVFLINYTDTYCPTVNYTQLVSSIYKNKNFKVKTEDLGAFQGHIWYVSFTVREKCEENHSQERNSITYCNSSISNSCQPSNQIFQKYFVSTSCCGGGRSAHNKTS